MAMSGAERQKAYRTRKGGELEKLRAVVRAVEQRLVVLEDLALPGGPESNINAVAYPTQIGVNRPPLPPVFDPNHDPGEAA